MSRRHRKTKQKSASLKPLLFLLAFLIFIGFTGYRYVKTVLTTLKKDRVNIVTYGKHTSFYSVGLREAGNYVVLFYPDLKVQLPGGYGVYRVGALGKLVALEKKPDIFKKAFSLATSTFVDYYFYKPTQEVYFGGAGDGVPDYPKVTDFIFEKSNASIGEKIALAYVMLKTPPQKFTVLNIVETEKGGERYLLPENFNTQYQGYFYRRSYSEEKKEVQILYSKDYESAEHISAILQGNGIRVSDISQTQTPGEYCRVKEDAAPFSYTARSIAAYFGCELVRDKTDIYDILLELSTKEREW